MMLNGKKDMGKGIKMTKGWDRESARHSLAKRVGKAPPYRNNKKITIIKPKQADPLTKIQKVAKVPEGLKLLKVEELFVPHPYMITPKHLEYSEGMYLDIEGAEKKGAVCDICRVRQKKFGEPILSYSEHKKENTLFIQVPQNKDLNAVKGLHKYLLKIKPIAEKLGITGFAFPTKEGVN